MSAFYQKCGAVLVLLALIALFLHFYSKTTLPYHAVVPITITPRNEIVVHPTLNGIPIDMILDLSTDFTNSTPMVYRPKEAYKQKVLSPGHTVYEAAIQLGVYTKTCQINPVGFAPPSFPTQGGYLGTLPFDSLAPSEAARIALDVRAKTLTIEWWAGRPRLRTTTQGILLPLHDAGIDVVCNGHATRMALNTTENASVLSQKSATELGLLTAKEAQLATSRSQGSYRPVRKRVPHPVMLEIGGVREPVEWYFENPNQYGLMGMEFLKNFRVTIDYRDRFVLLEPYTKP